MTASSSSAAASTRTSLQKRNNVQRRGGIPSAPLRKQKRQAGELVFSYVISCQKSDGAFNLIGTEASCTDVDMAGRTIDDCFHALYIGLPSSVGASVRVRDFNAERNALAANIALCQLLHLQSLRKSSKTRRRNTPLHILAEISRKSKRKNAKNKIFLRMVAQAA